MPLKLNITDIIKKANKIHSNKYDYSKFIYKNSNTKSIIICPIHGEFKMSMSNHIHKSKPQGCKFCNKNYTKEDFIKKSSIIHNNKYDYSLIPENIKSNIKISIICPIHGNFTIKPYRHMKEQKGCPFCSKSGRPINNKLSSNLQNYKYEILSNLENIKTSSYVQCLCSKHGEFRIKVAHILENRSCPSCSKNTFESFIEKANLIHNNKYTYINSDRKTYVTVICPIHGRFEQKRQSHLNAKEPCKLCRINICNKYNIDRVDKTHNFKYNLNLIDLDKGTAFKQKIICPEHGIFEMKLENLIHGQNCPECSQYAVGYKLTSFKNACIKNNNGLGIFYILKCWNENEEFYKIGITSRSIKQRYKNKIAMPYNYSITQEISNIPELIWELEKLILKTLKDKKYIPKLKFNGSSKECLKF